MELRAAAGRSNAIASFLKSSGKFSSNDSKEQKNRLIQSNLPLFSLPYSILLPAGFSFQNSDVKYCLVVNAPGGRILHYPITRGYALVFGGFRDENSVNGMYFLRKISGSWCKFARNSGNALVWDSLRFSYCFAVQTLVGSHHNKKYQNFPIVVGWKFKGNRYVSM